MRQSSLPFVSDTTFYFERIQHLPWPMLLDSNQPASHYGRFDIMTAKPDCVIKVCNGVCSINRGEYGDGFTPQTADAFDIIADELSKLTLNCALEELPFYGGALGLFGYDYGRELETLPVQAIKDIYLPDLWVGIFSWAIINDHQKKRSWLISHLDEQGHQELLDLCVNAKNSVIPTPTRITTKFHLTKEFSSNMSQAEYQEKFAAIQDYIYAGDCYQVCLAQRFQSSYKGHPWQAYKQLRQKSPSPFASYLETDEGAVISLSPERFLKANNNQVETRPIKGTRPRGSTPVADQALAQQLANSGKDKAENLIIVDLLRNDLSKHCLPGSVAVPELFAIESYSNVHHMITTVTGKLANHQQILPLLKGAFPGGSVTGAPKIRAMEIIEELEPHRRSAYTGSIGYISYHGAMDSNILIRTLVTSSTDNRGGNIYCWAGGGLIADSNCDDEYRETFDKVNNLLTGLALGPQL